MCNDRGNGLLLLSNSRTANGFLVDYLAEIRDFAGGGRRAAFIPFASVQRPWLAECRARGLLKEIQERVRKGMKYIGWSAGSNLACPTIKTTNDMPIVDPGGLEALGLLPFQLNCHYTSQSIPGHQGETRDQRLAEFARVGFRCRVPRGRSSGGRIRQAVPAGLFPAACNLRAPACHLSDGGGHA